MTGDGFEPMFHGPAETARRTAKSAEDSARQHRPRRRGLRPPSAVTNRGLLLPTVMRSGCPSGATGSRRLAHEQRCVRAAPVGPPWSRRLAHEQRCVRAAPVGPPWSRRLAHEQRCVRAAPVGPPGAASSARRATLRSGCPSGATVEPASCSRATLRSGCPSGATVEPASCCRAPAPRSSDGCSKPSEIPGRRGWSRPSRNGRRPPHHEAPRPLRMARRRSRPPVQPRPLLPPSDDV